jgi:hypothetical protein
LGGNGFCPNTIYWGGHAVCPDTTHVGYFQCLIIWMVMQILMASVQHTQPLGAHGVCPTHNT